MDQKTRIGKIKLIETEANKCGEKEIEWMDELKPFIVYKIPVEYLIYNKYNGRIFSYTKSYEHQRYMIDPETSEGKQLIEKYLWDSKTDRNKRTMEDIDKYGQKEVGIITRDGIIIDGNRRAMLINRINETKGAKQISYFKAVILPVTLEENRIEVEKLEMSYQMGEDKKLDYNPIEKYLKVDDLIKEGGGKINEKDIASWMGESESTIKDLLSVKKTMDDYLDYLGYNGIYTQLDGREDHFINLTKRLGNFYGKESPRGFTGYEDTDVDDLKFIAFDYIRTKCEGKNFRNLAEGLKEKHIFGDKNIWEKFRDEHYAFTKSIKEKEEPINQDSENLEAHLSDRDEKFKIAAYGFMEENFELHKQKIQEKKQQKEPDKAMIKALEVMGEILGDKKKCERLSKDTLAKIKTLEKATEPLQKKDEEVPLQKKEEAPQQLKTMDNIIEILTSMNLKEYKGPKHDIIEKIDTIFKIVTKLKENIGS